MEKKLSICREVNNNACQKKKVGFMCSNSLCFCFRLHLRLGWLLMPVGIYICLAFTNICLTFFCRSNRTHILLSRILPMFSNSGYNRYETHYGAILADDLTETRISTCPTNILETFDTLFVVKSFMPMPVLRLWVHTKDVRQWWALRLSVLKIL